MCPDAMDESISENQGWKCYSPNRFAVGLTVFLLPLRLFVILFSRKRRACVCVCFHFFFFFFFVFVVVSITGTLKVCVYVNTGACSLTARL